MLPLEQGLQIMNDVSTFGGFTNTFLSKIRDDLPKLPCLSFPMLSSSMPETVDVDDVSTLLYRLISCQLQ
jgi:hypothetical protein